MNLIHEKWTKDKYEEFIIYLKNQRDEKYAQFHSKLIKDSANIIGIRVPILRKIAKEISIGNYKEFLLYCGSQYYEEIMIEGFVIGQLNIEYEEFISLVDNFINKINTWSACDSFCSGLKMIKRYKDEFWSHIEGYLNSKNDWKIRVGLIIMLGNYLDQQYINLVLKRCDEIKNDYYYVKMGQAWLIATAYCKFPKETHKYLLNCSLDDWTYNKAIQKACESYRIDVDKKEILRKMKRK